MRNIIEKILYFFFKGKAEKIKKDAFFERNNTLIEYKATELKHQKKMNKYSGRKRYQKA